MVQILTQEEADFFQGVGVSNAFGDEQGTVTYADQEFLVYHDGGQKRTYAGGGNDTIEMHFEQNFANTFI